jgi:hypothetical protein
MARVGFIKDSKTLVYSPTIYKMVKIDRKTRQNSSPFPIAFVYALHCYPYTNG